MTLTVTSRLHEAVTAHALLAHFSGRVCKRLVHTPTPALAGGTRGSGVCADVDAAGATAAASLLLSPGENIFSFSLPAPEAVMTYLPGPDPALCLEKIELVFRPAAAAVTATTAAAGEGAPAVGTNGSEEEGLVLEISALSPAFAKALREREAALAAGATGAKQAVTLRDLALFVGLGRSPALLAVARPVALLELVRVRGSGSRGDAGPQAPASAAAAAVAAPSSSSTAGRPHPPAKAEHAVSLLQGPIQRLDFVFQTGASHVIDGRVFLSSDFSPPAPSAALFWYPDVAAVAALYASLPGAWGAGQEPTAQQLDAIPFHPALLNSSCQPALPLALPPLPPHTTFTVPVFVRSELQNTFKIRLLTEYIPRPGHTRRVAQVRLIRPPRPYLGPM